MANSDNPHGLLPRYCTSGAAPWVEEFDKLVGYGTAMYLGDAVARVASGAIEIPATPGTTRITGVNLNWGKVSTATKHLVVLNPDMLFEAQADGILAEADMGLNANLIYGAGDGTALKSGHEINSATEDVTATLDVHLLKKLDVEGNAYGANVRLEILINKHRLATDSVGV
jgi:hypothetical protein